MSKLFRFYLTKDQILEMIEHDEKAAEAWENGNPGGIFCQVGRSKKDPDQFLVKGCFLPNEH